MAILLCFYLCLYGTTYKRKHRYCAYHPKDVSLGLEFVLYPLRRLDTINERYFYTLVEAMQLSQLSPAIGRPAAQMVYTTGTLSPTPYCSHSQLLASYVHSSPIPRVF